MRGELVSKMSHLLFTASHSFKSSPSGKVTASFKLPEPSVASAYFFSWYCFVPSGMFLWGLNVWLFLLRQDKNLCYKYVNLTGPLMLDQIDYELWNEENLPKAKKTHVCLCVRVLSVGRKGFKTERGRWLLLLSFNTHTRLSCWFLCERVWSLATVCCTVSPPLPPTNHRRSQHGIITNSKKDIITEIIYMPTN